MSQNLQEVYDTCITNGKIKEKTPDKELILAKKSVAEKGLKFINNKEILDDEWIDEWIFVFREHYEALRGLTEAYLLLEGITAENHQCTFAHICSQHEELILDWNFLELIRKKRNAINYRGQQLKKEEWNLLKLNFDLHISALTEAIEQQMC